MPSATNYDLHDQDMADAINAALKPDGRQEFNRPVTIEDVEYAVSMILALCRRKAATTT